MKIALVGLSFNDSLGWLKNALKSYDQIVAVDGGLLLLHEMDITPDLIIGDFDSVSDELLQKYKHISQKRFPADKDQSDLELAITAFEGDEIVAFGASNGHTDHTLYNLFLLGCHNFSLESEHERIFVIEKEASLPPGRLSLIPLFGPVTGVTTQGLKWELTNATLDPSFMSLSNVALENRTHISIRKGKLLCILGR